MGAYKYREGYRYRFILGGDLHEGYGFPSKRAALEAEWKKRAELGAPSRRVRSELTFREVVALYDREVLAPRAGRNVANVRRSLGRFVTAWGERRLDHIEPDDVEQWRRERTGQTVQRRGGLRPVTGATINRDLDYLASLYTWAQGRRLVAPDWNPAKRSVVKRAKEEWRPWVILSQDQLQQLYASLPEHEASKVELLANLGVRKQVVLDLEWERVDWAHRLLQYTSKGKSKVHPFNERAYKLLRGLHEGAGEPPAGRVFQERTDTTLRRWWDRARRELGLPDLRRHDLRVTFARMLASKGADLKTIQGLLGHSTLTMTARYIPSDLQAQRAAVALLDGGTT